VNGHPDGASLLGLVGWRALARLRRGLGWTAQQVAAMAGWKEACVSAWCRQGLIAATPFPRSRGIGYTIEPEALAAFQARFVTVAALASGAGCSPRGMLRRLADAGVVTHGAFIDGTARRGHVVRIADLVPVVAGAPAPQTINHATRSSSLIAFGPIGFGQTLCRVQKAPAATGGSHG
jgi:hypothetical protein